MGQTEPFLCEECKENLTQSNDVSSTENLISLLESSLGCVEYMEEFELANEIKAAINEYKN